MMDLFAPLLAFVGGYVGTRLLTRAYNVNADWRARRLLRRAWPPELPRSFGICNCRECGNRFYVDGSTSEFFPKYCCYCGRATKVNFLNGVKISDD